MSNLAGYVNIIIDVRIAQAQKKPFLGKPYIEFLQANSIWGYFMQLGAMLASRYRAHLDMFGRAFMGAAGPPGAVKQYFEHAAEQLAADYALEQMSFFDLVTSYQMRQSGDGGAAADFIVRSARSKVPSVVVGKLAWTYAQYGAALGAIKSALVRGMYERTYRPESQTGWGQARLAGLELPGMEDPMTYEDADADFSASFIDYCRLCSPELCTALER